MNYTIVFSNESISDITQKVNEHIANGWKPIGGISTTSHDFKLGAGTDLVYLQAMVKE